ncbi:MAG TPA: helicase C-terminal domain-containing protein [Treponemataceae bacterium]|nr:helicase C-terminal domain-containing protein [Treponemataceae bacterium]
MSDIDKRFSSTVREELIQAITDANNNEVFFTGMLNGEGLVISVSIAARGNRTSVPVIQSAVETADVLIHNHPSGNLTPSDADLEIASRVSESGLGFYIIDSPVTDVYVVVEPVLVREKKPLDSDAVAALLDETGPLSYLTEGYEERSAQIQLTHSIAQAFNAGSIGVFEAGTGVGKSFAYLLPAMSWSLQNKDRVVISTGTINLQQQLIAKDIPMAEKIIGQPVKAVLLKGRQNYICKRRLAEAIQDSRQDSDLFEDETNELEQIAQWATVTEDGSRSDLSFVPHEAIWSRICSESDACMGMRCSFHDDCFVMKVRKEAASASILIVNHHLLFADLEVRMAGAGYDDTVVLPPFHHIIFDEAHSMEDAATSFFSEYFTRFKLLKQLSVLYRVRRNSVGGHLVSLERLSSSGGEIQNALAAISDVKAAFSAVEDAALELLTDSNTWRLSPATERQAEKLLPLLSALRTSLAEFVGIIRGIIDGIDEDNIDDPVVWESKFALKRLELVGLLCLHFCEWSERGESVFWIEKKRLVSRASRGTDSETTWYPRFVQTPLSIAQMMKEGVFEPLRTVICTSATLRIAGRFDYWLKRTGVQLMDSERVLTGFYDSPFPYKKNVLLAIPEDAPLPESPSFQPWIETAIVSLLQASGGRSLVLFTSYESLRSACEVSRAALSPFGITIFKQGDDDRARLLEAFKTDETSVLFATDSFWQGVDAPGDTLLQVILVKLPFRVPNDPVLAARSEAITRAGGNAFMELSLPEAVVRFRQGFGRLMRKNSDRGVVTVLDRRLLAKKYGSLFLQSLPETATSFSPASHLYQKIENWIYP